MSPDALRVFRLLTAAAVVVLVIVYLVQADARWLYLAFCAFMANQLELG
jgi:hypothetical protein